MLADTDQPSQVLGYYSYGGPFAPGTSEFLTTLPFFTPLHIAVITDYVLRDESQIGRSLVLSAVSLGPVAAFLMIRALRTFGRWQNQE